MKKVYCRRNLSLLMS